MITTALAWWGRYTDCRSVPASTRPGLQQKTIAVDPSSRLDWGDCGGMSPCDRCGVVRCGVVWCGMSPCDRCGHRSTARNTDLCLVHFNENCLFPAGPANSFQWICMFGPRPQPGCAVLRNTAPAGNRVGENQSDSIKPLLMQLIKSFEDFGILYSVLSGNYYQLFFFK